MIRRARSGIVFGLSVVLALSTSAAVRGADASTRVEAHLAAGEFVAAAAAASELPAGEAAEAQARIRAARQGGDYAAQQRVSGAATPTAEQSQRPLSGSGADFQTLMDLIMEQTTGPWEELDGEGGTMTPFESGVRVDPQGVLSRVERQDLDGRLAAIGVRARKASLNEDVAAASDLRIVSLTRLEREVADRLARGERVLDSMKQLAGLSEIRYVFADSETGEILIAGPAEGWTIAANGAPVGAASGRPTLRLDDLVVVLRTFEPAARQMFGCSIDPRADGLKAVKSFVEDSQRRGPLASGQARRWAEQIGDLLGRQDITVYGIPTDSRVARVLVEADYRMKLIGVGKLEGGKDIPSYFDLIARQPGLAQGSLDALRWWLTLNTDEVLYSPDRDAFEIRGASVKCLSENQFLTASGERASTGKTEPINRQFAENFTRHYNDLAREQPVFADLKGVFDLALAAAIIRHEGLDTATGWNRGAFAQGGAYEPARYMAPKEVDSVVNHRVFNGRDVVVQVAGGVRADILATVSNPEIRRESDEVGQTAVKAKASALPEGRWWWDAAR
ncbi:MAG: DUF1598 domain-containing protein [Planctomyces sp.]|nr:DUF1598 domain-containing protein [Planctomyces sp.]